ncbi:hypothetical protein DPX16_4318 [Anabarilius grahami]|uniref:Uncharacterized protein n=1 Tax=Anabarilius grahami TaxID=495550 RepID=A0A3N0YDE2_ANAGA|nr:hypothetical protein DPX16_4318 [Anabarilius grahami]
MGALRWSSPNSLRGVVTGRESELLGEEALSSASPGPAASALPAEQEMVEEDRETTFKTCMPYALKLALPLESGFEAAALLQAGPLTGCLDSHLRVE